MDGWVSHFPWAELLAALNHGRRDSPVTQQYHTCRDSAAGWMARRRETTTNVYWRQAHMSELNFPIEQHGAKNVRLCIWRGDVFTNTAPQNGHGSRAWPSTAGHAVL